MSAEGTLSGAAPRGATDWHSINWKKVYRNVRRLQARIVKAMREGKWHKVKALVYLLTHSFSGRALAILRVTTHLSRKVKVQIKNTNSILNYTADSYRPGARLQPKLESSPAVEAVS